MYIRIFTAPQFSRRALVVGGGRAGKTIIKVIDRVSPSPFYLVGVLDDDPGKFGTKIEGHKVLAGSEHLLEIIETERVSDILVAISGEMHGKTFQALLDAQERGVEIIRMPVTYEELLGRVPIRLLEAEWLLRSFVDESRVSGFYEIGKRTIDIFGGLVGLMMLVIVLPLVGIAILIEDGRPIFYTQTRLGKGAQPYEIIKFRTMLRDAEPDGKPQWAKEDDERATKVGRFLRKSHIDEIPQFINVLRGEMSLVGPRSERPELVEHFQRHVPFYRARLLVKPGITGWAQVNYSYAATIDETITKLEYDLYYIKHRNLMLDTMVLFRTPATMLGMRGQ
jgi:exopolysaccharide biosynthesis polyprenyl glycosylphosphotransferase